MDSDGIVGRQPTIPAAQLSDDAIMAKKRRFRSATGRGFLVSYQLTLVIICNSIENGDSIIKKCFIILRVFTPHIAVEFATINRQLITFNNGNALLLMLSYAIINVIN